MLFIVSIFIFVGVLETLTPYLARKTTVFGVSIPEPYVQHQQLLIFKKHYSMMVGSIAVACFIGQILLLFTSIQEEQFVLLSFVLLYVVLLIAAGLYMFYHIKTKSMKKQENWEAHVKTVYVMDLSIRDRDEVLSPTFFALPIIISLALITFTYMNYNAIPDVFATHWNAAGEVDGRTEKTWLSVIVMPLILLGIQISFFIISIGMKNAKIQLSAQAKEASANRELNQRKYGSWYLAAINYSMTIVLVVLHYTTVILKNQTASYFFPLFIVFMFVSLGGLILLIWKLSNSNERFVDLHTNETAADDDRYWKWGIVYLNKNDPSLLVQKKYGVGWTVNLANKWSYIILLVIFLPILLVIFI
ncbi:DUF1648 domain-containing protein [Lysinibacillus sp. NPDC095746]|uniref:DUF1648 domain-containing protein n=1 Tax=Lysinibacillus sp. NPDC095746 TaxID=3364134 RepID=UPI003804CF40